MSRNDRTAELREYHNAGQADGSANRYSPPHSVGFMTRLTYSEDFVRELEEDNSAYDAGYDHGWQTR